MQTVVISDLHGKDVWKKIVSKENFDKVVFLGDYFDSYDIPYDKQMENFKKIIKFKKKNKDKVVILLGNHDLHNLSELNERYSGYQYLKEKDIEIE